MSISKSEWFKKYFNFTYVWGDNHSGFTSEHKLLKQRTKEEVEGILKITNLEKDTKILDASCGYGRHTIELASKGFFVVGIDINKFFLKVARYRAENGLDVYEKETYNPKFTRKAIFKQIDVRKLPDNLWNKFDCVITMFSSLGFFGHKDNLKVLRNFYKALKSNGQLIIHTNYHVELFKNTPYLSEKERKVFRTKILGKIYPEAMLVYKKWYNPKTRIFNSIWQIKINNDLFPKIPIKSRVIIYLLREYQKYLTEIGFHNIKFYKNWRAGGFNSGKEAEELIIIATK